MEDAEATLPFSILHFPFSLECNFGRFGCSTCLAPWPEVEVFCFHFRYLMQVALLLLLLLQVPLPAALPSIIYDNGPSAASAAPRSPRTLRILARFASLSTTLFNAAKLVGTYLSLAVGPLPSHPFATWQHICIWVPYVSCLVGFSTTFEKCSLGCFPLLCFPSVFSAPALNEVNQILMPR